MISETAIIDIMRTTTTDGQHQNTMASTIETAAATTSSVFNASSDADSKSDALPNGQLV